LPRRQPHSFMRFPRLGHGAAQEPHRPSVVHLLAADPAFAPLGLGPLRFATLGRPACDALRLRGMDVPEPRYAKSGDAHFAYRVEGEGPFDVVFVRRWPRALTSPTPIGRTSGISSAG